MNLAVSSLASVIPQGKGIECLNYYCYEVQALHGKLHSDYYQADTLFSTLVQELDDNNLSNAGIETVNILIDSGLDAEHKKNLSDCVLVNSTRSALEAAQTHCRSPGRRARIFLLCLNTDLTEEIEAPVFFLETSFDTANHSGHRLHYGLAIEVSTFDNEAPSSCYGQINMLAGHQDLSSLLSTLAEKQLRPDSIELGSAETALFYGLAAHYAGNPLSIALSSVACIFGYQENNAEFLSLVKACLQCYHRYIAGVGGWTHKRDDLPWEGSDFYVAEQSRSWFVDGQDTPRYCLTLSKPGNDVFACLVSDEKVGLDRDSQYFAYACPHLFPLAADNSLGFDKVFTQLRRELDDIDSNIQLRRLAKQYYQRFLDEEDELHFHPYRAALLAEDKSTLLAELDLLQSGIASCFDDDSKHEIKTPKGSYFTVEPLGEEGKLAFVFPGLGSSYIGLGQKIFQLFPSIFKESFRFTENVGKELQESSLYPRTQDTLSFKERRQRDMDMVMNLKDLGKTDTTYSSICAHVMTDVFHVTPDMAFGYSMGEANMMTALDVWQRPTELEERFKQSDIFKQRLYGDMTTVKRFWQLPEATPASQLWATFTLKATQAEVEHAIRDKQLERVYLTLHNTEDNVVIAGQPEQCLLLIQQLGCRAIPMGFVPAIHCEITAEEYEGIAKLYSMPTTESCKTKLYSSSCYLPVPVRQKAIAYAIAKCFCEPVDFPRLVNKVYHDGARIFLEAGAGRTCSTWIDKILDGQKHVIVPLNAKGTEDSLTFARVMAKLFCHKVDVSLHPLYDNVS